MDWLSILNQCLDVILPAIASVIAILFGVLGAKIKRLYTDKVQDETIKTVVDSVVKWVQQVYYDLDGQGKLEKALERASQTLKEKGITVSKSELNTLIESAVYGLKQGIAETTLVEGTTEELPEAVETVADVTTTEE